MCYRFFYAMREAWRYRKQLKSYMEHADLQLANICDLTRVNLTALGITALALDYDGVLAAHGEPAPRPEVVQFLNDLGAAMPDLRLYVLTNRPSLQLQDYFQHNFPKIKFIWGKRKKPYPDGLQQILVDAEVPAAQLALVDDRLLTGILATQVVGTKGFWVTKPYINFKHRPFAEIGIMLLRRLERLCIKCLG